MKIEKVLIIGSGALKIGEAGEFDYSGTQALKALKEENIYTILINPNIATVQTSESIADKIYFLPITTHFVEKIIKKEKPQGILLAFGGQTALNCGIDLFKRGVIKKYNLKVLGTSIESIIDSEDRDIFREKLNIINIHTAKSIAVNSLEKALEAVVKIGFPVIIRSAYALGGLGSGFANNLDELKILVSQSLSYTDQVLIEESLKGWKEIEYEIVRDNFNNCIAVCNMENFDPIGIHTGESIVVAPSQTLTNYEYHKLRTISIHIARYFKIIGECNVQFALSPNSSEYRVIEINARLSRSSALASKATGYPLAFIAAKISLGYGLHQLKNVVNKKTSAFFEPALDYVVCKLPRWDLKKFYGVSDKIGSSMKSIGEVMAIGGSFEEAFQKGIRMLDIGLKGFINNTYYDKQHFNNTLINTTLKEPTDQRIIFLELAFEKEYTIEEIHNLTKIDIWFLYKLENLYKTKKILESYKNWMDIPDDDLWTAKKQGFSDEQILGFYVKESEIFSNIKSFKNMRISKGILPYTRQIDTLAAEYPSYTNYLYLTYHSSQHDISYKDDKKSIIVLGSGVYRIGSSVEFDWCCVNSLQTIQQLGYRGVMINYNPETVSTDFDICDRLYFEELNIERILDIIDLENPKGVIVSMGGQIPNNLALKLYQLGVPILGTSPISIDGVENRYKFSKALDLLKINQPRWKELTDYISVDNFIKDVGYPVLIRPSYVLSGAAMNVVFNSKELEKYLKEAVDISPTYPVVVTKFIDNAKEIEFDAVAYNGKIIYHAISEHIEFAGVHSGDATLIYPTQNIYLSTLDMIYKSSKKIAKYFNISGPFNIQFLSKNNKIQVIECNLRASRSFPFVSKISRFNMINLATRVLLNKKITINKKTLIKHIGIKASQFSFSRLQGADPILRVDMTSTGEVGCIGYNFNDVIIKAMLSVGYNIPKKNILISGESITSKMNLIEIVELLYNHNYKIYTTKNIYKLLLSYNINTICLYYTSENKLPKVIDFIKNKKIDLIVNLHKNAYKSNDNNDYYIRRTAIDFNVPLLTNDRLAKSFIKAFCKIKYDQLDISDWNSYFNI